MPAWERYMNPSINNVKTATQIAQTFFSSFNSIGLIKKRYPLLLSTIWNVLDAGKENCTKRDLFACCKSPVMV